MSCDFYITLICSGKKILRCILTLCKSPSPSFTLCSSSLLLLFCPKLLHLLLSSSSSFSKWNSFAIFRRDLHQCLLRPLLCLFYITKFYFTNAFCKINIFVHYFVGISPHPTCSLKNSPCYKIQSFAPFSSSTIQLSTTLMMFFLIYM